MTDDRIDFSAVDVRADEERFEGVVRSIMASAATELSRRQARYNVMGQVVRWRRPMLAAAVALLVVSVTVLARLDAAPTSADPHAGIAEAIGVPTQLAQWVSSEQPPTTNELLETWGVNQ